MRDDLFEFLAAQRAGNAAREAGRAAEQAKRAAEVRSIIDKVKGHQRSLCGQRKSGIPD
jgi:hypothetical protein